MSRQAFYDWRLRATSGPTEAEQAEEGLVELLRDIHDDFDETYGSPRMTVELTNRGAVVNRKRVERLMRVHGIVGVHKPAKVRTTIPAEHNPPLPDLVGRRFDSGVPDVAWVSDITYIPTGQGWLYLATVLDLGSRRLLGYSMATHMRTRLITDALDMAAGIRGGATAGIIFHSDRGSQYMSREFAQAIADRGRWELSSWLGDGLQTPRRRSGPMAESEQSRSRHPGAGRHRIQRRNPNRKENPRIKGRRLTNRPHPQDLAISPGPATDHCRRRGKNRASGKHGPAHAPFLASKRH